MSTMSLRAAVVAGVVAALLGPVRPAVAACHAFTISVSPSTVDEGGSVTVRVDRDGDVSPSSVRVRTVDRTAKAGSDYAASDRTVTFTDGTRESFVVGTTDDGAREGAETFRVELVEGSGAGCGTSYVYGPPAVVTIRANDQPLPTSPPPTTRRPTSPPPTVSRSPLPVVSSRPATTTTAPATPARTTSPASVTMTPVPLRTSASPSHVPSSPAGSPAPAAQADPDSGGLPVVPLALGALALAGLLGVAGFRLRRAR